MLHPDKAETKPLFCQKYPFHFSFCPASHQIKSTLTNIVTHPRSTFFGKQSVCYKKHHPALPVCHRHTGRGAGASPSPWLTVSTALPAHPGRDSPNELSQPHHVYLTTVVGGRVFVSAVLSWVPISQAPGSCCSSQGLPMRSPMPSPALQRALFHLAVHR